MSKSTTEIASGAVREIIAPKIPSALESARFMDLFRDKAPLADYLRALLVYMILNSSASLLGTAVHATAMCARP
jgi:glucokinase